MHPEAFLKALNFDIQTISHSIIDLDKISLTDMWRAADGKASQKPAQWLRHEDTQNFLKTLEKKPKGVSDTHLKKISGRGGGTFGHYQVALAYATYLSPEFHIWCNEVVKLHIEYDANPEKG